MRLRLGFVALTDAAPLIVAAAHGFAADEGLTIELEREASWATLRDRLALGHLDGAHVLAPLAIASGMGLSGPRAALFAPFALNLNGNAVTVSRPIWEAMREAGAGDGLEVTARAFVATATSRRAVGLPMTIATTFPFSNHTYQLGLFARLGGARLSDIADMVVVPPPLMVEAMTAGSIDGFCVGSPWNSLAVEAGIGRIVAFGSMIVPDCPEKVLALRAPLVERPETAALVRALQRAGDLCADPAHHGAVAALLGESRHLAIDPAIIRRTLEGRLVVGPGEERFDPHYIRFGGAAHRPEPAHEQWCLARMVEAGQIAPDRARTHTPLYRAGLYDAALLNR